MLKCALVLSIAALIGSGAPEQEAKQPEPAKPGEATGAEKGKPSVKPASLVEARRGFKSDVRKRTEKGEPPDQPPAEHFTLVEYKSPVGMLPAYLAKMPKDGRRRPAIIWIHGGTCNDIGDCWTEQPPENDQRGAEFRLQGVVSMHPALRGGNGGPGQHEGYLGEVDDVLAAAEFLAKQDGVDPTRIYLGGHSTGGTLALLTACCNDRFRAVFSLGPTNNVAGYGEDQPFNANHPREVALRSPEYWLTGIKSPTFVFEGIEEPSNIGAAATMEIIPHSTAMRFFAIEKMDHFQIIVPVTRMIAKKILLDKADVKAFTLTEQEVRAGTKKN